MHVALRSTIWALLTVFAAACPAENEGNDDAAGTSATDGSGSATSTGTTNGPIDDPEAFCASRTSQRECDYFDEAANVFCAWWTVTPATLTDGACSLGERIGGCFAMTGGTTAAGCGPPPGCDGEPWYREVDGVVHVSMQCGGSPPVGYEPCTYVEPGVFDPPECTCLCTEPIDPGTTTG